MNWVLIFKEFGMSTVTAKKSKRYSNTHRNNQKTGFYWNSRLLDYLYTALA